MEWANTETDNFLSINKYIFSNSEDFEPSEFTKPFSSIASRVKSLPKSNLIENESSSNEIQFPFSGNFNMKFTETGDYKEK